MMADARVQLARMPFDLGYDAAGLAPALCPIGETGIVAAHLVRRSSDRTLQQIADSALQDVIGWQPDRVADALGFAELVHLGIGESCITWETEALYYVPIAGDHRLQHRLPTGGTVHVAWPQRAALDIAELVEHEQRVIAGPA